MSTNKYLDSLLPDRVVLVLLKYKQTNKQKLNTR